MDARSPRRGAKAAPKPTERKPEAKRHREQRALVLQGGGALGAYQGGVYQEVAAAGLEPDWIAGISIGAINAAIIAGNPPEKRVEQLAEFWRRISSTLIGRPLMPGEQSQSLFNEASAAMVASWGVPGFFRPRFPPPFLQQPGAVKALSFYDTGPLHETLEELVDFDRINNGDIRLSVGAVNVRTGNFIYFDNRQCRIGPHHIMASGALPPGFPPVEIDGEFYWDGGLVSNAPLQYVIDNRPGTDMLILQVDLFGARGAMPRTLFEASQRSKDIRFSSRTRLNTDNFCRLQELGTCLHRLLQKLPKALQDDPDVQLLARAASAEAVTIVHLIHRRENSATASKGYEFSRRSMIGHWEAGRKDVLRTLRHPEWINRGRPISGVRTFDLTRDAND
jgi:NTE family protein